MDPRLERRLIKRAQRGDMAAFEQLYRAHRDALYHRIIRPRVYSEADAEDVLVDTFTTALERLDRFTWTGRSLLAWLARIAANKCHDVGRRLGRDDRARAALARRELTPPPLPDDVASMQAERRVARERVEEVLKKMNQRYARALRLRLLEDRSRQECAELMEVKLGTFDVVLLRATRAFRKQWVAQYGEDEVL